MYTLRTYFLSTHVFRTTVPTGGNVNREIHVTPCWGGGGGGGADQLANYKCGLGIETRDYHVTNPASGPGGN